MMLLRTVQGSMFKNIMESMKGEGGSVGLGSGRS